jgi:hypothetical protein
VKLEACCWCCVQGDLQRLLSQESSLKEQVGAIQERIASMERARSSDKAFLQVGCVVTRGKGGQASAKQRQRQQHQL